MKRSELHYRYVSNDSFSPSNRTQPPRPRGSANPNIEERILSLYAEGMSVESITREVGRARHLVVHVLQSRGVFRTTPSEPVPGEPEAKGEPLTSPDAVTPIEEDPMASAAVAPKDAAPPAVTRPRRFRASEGRPTKPQTQADPKHRDVPRKPEGDAWSPQVVEALFEVVTKGEIDSGMSMDEVRRLVTRRRRLHASRG